MSNAPMPPTASRIGCTSPTSPKQRSLAGSSSRASAPPVPGCRSACRPLSACAGRPRSRSSRRGPIGAIRWCSRRPGTRGAARSGFPSAPRSSGSSSMRPRRWPWARVWSHRATPPTATTCSTFATSAGRAGIHAFHGHRHLYAQERYREMTGWQCPARGGPTSRQLTPEAEGPRSRGAGDHQP